MPTSRAVMDQETCDRCRMLHGTAILPPHGACMNHDGCRCSAAYAPGEVLDLSTVDVSALEADFGNAVTDSLGDEEEPAA